MNSHVFLDKYDITVFLELEKGKIMYDASAQMNVLVKCQVLCVTADNPRASEFEHHLGSSAIQFCRKCDVRYILKYDRPELMVTQYVL